MLDKPGKQSDSLSNIVTDNSSSPNQKRDFPKTKFFDGLMLGEPCVGFIDGAFFSYSLKHK